MESLDTILERNRKKARNLMLDNNVTHISITDNEAFGIDTDAPFVILPKKDRETYQTQVSMIWIVLTARKRYTTRTQKVMRKFHTC